MPNQEQEIELELRQLQPGDKFSSFRLGDASLVALKTFIRKNAHAYERQSLARTYVALYQNKTIAYLTLVCGEVTTDEGGEPLVSEPGLDFRYPRYPAVKIARLAVDQRYHGKKIGKLLVQLALGISKEEICPAVGCRFLMVDAKPAAVAFYSRVGFTMLDTHGNKDRKEPVMFIDLGKTPGDEQAA